MTTPHTLAGTKDSDTTLDTTRLESEKQNHLNDTTSTSSEHSQHNGVSGTDVEKAVASSDAEAGPAAPAHGRPAFMDPASFPDGGLKAWLCVLGAFCALFVSFGTESHAKKFVWDGG